MKKVKSIAQFDKTLNSDQLSKISGGLTTVEYIIILALTNDDKESDGGGRS
ncbi:MAG: hypothetical protein ACI8ZM_002126 [Crocinitomix sp.]|jgi:hypothetical protein